MKKKEVKRGLICNLRGVNNRVMIVSNDVNWESQMTGLPPRQHADARGVLVGYVNHEGKLRTRGKSGRFVAALQCLQPVPKDEVPEEDAPPEEPSQEASSQPEEKPSLETLLERLTARVEALEKRELIMVTCPDCRGSGLNDNILDARGKCDRCGGYGSIPALEPLETPT